MYDLYEALDRAAKLDKGLLTEDTSPYDKNDVVTFIKKELGAAGWEVNANDDYIMVTSEDDDHCFVTPVKDILTEIQSVTSLDDPEVMEAVFDLCVDETYCHTYGQEDEYEEDKKRFLQKYFNTAPKKSTTVAPMTEQDVLSVKQLAKDVNNIDDVRSSWSLPTHTVKTSEGYRIHVRYSFSDMDQSNLDALVAAGYNEEEALNDEGTIVKEFLDNKLQSVVAKYSNLNVSVEHKLQGMYGSFVGDDVTLTVVSAQGI